jgi:hypothetical protein
MVHNDSDEELAARLDSALRSGLGATSVDVGALLDGSRRRARRVRSQRIAAIAAAGALVVAVPVSYEVIRPERNQVVQPAAMLPSGSLTEMPWSAQPTPPRPVTPVSIPSAQPSTPVPINSKATSKPQASSKVIGSAVYQIPDSVAFTAAELPDGLTLSFDGASPRQPTVIGQGCDPGNPDGARPIAGRQWSWVDGSGKMTSTSVSLIVTGWKSGTGRVAFDQFVADTGYCRWVDPQTAVDFSTTASDQTWSGTSVSSANSSLKYGRAVVRLGDLIAGVQVQDASGTGAAVKLAQSLAVASCKHLQASGLTAAKSP